MSCRLPRKRLDPILPDGVSGVLKIMPPDDQEPEELEQLTRQADAMLPRIYLFVKRSVRLRKCHSSLKPISVIRVEIALLPVWKPEINLSLIVVDAAFRLLQERFLKGSVDHLEKS